jgi:hypothetical protein
MKEVPKEIIDSLSEEELREFLEVKALRQETMAGFPVKKMRSSNRGLHYLLMDDPFKYSLLQFEEVDEAELMALLAYDANGLDEYHLMFWQGREKEGLWNQRFDSVMAALGNPNMSCENAKLLLDSLMNEAHEPIPSEEFLNVVTYQLEDKWTLHNFNSEVLGALVNLLEQEGMTDHLPRYKRLQRRALKKEGLR